MNLETGNGKKRMAVQGLSRARVRDFEQTGVSKRFPFLQSKDAGSR